MANAHILSLIGFQLVMLVYRHQDVSVSGWLNPDVDLVCGGIFSSTTDGQLHHTRLLKYSLPI
jgi:hypothetical protein